SSGFWVATTMNGRGRRGVVPSTVTWAWAIASSSADWVRGGARLSSSASTSSWKSGPGGNWKSLVSAGKARTPGASAGIRSAVNWNRAWRSPHTLASPSARVVFPTPGASSRRRWPPATTVVSASSTALRLPRTTRERASAARASSSCAAGAAWEEKGRAGAVTEERPGEVAAGLVRLGRLPRFHRPDPEVPEHPLLVPAQPREPERPSPESEGECVDGEVDECTHAGEVHHEGAERQPAERLGHCPRRPSIQRSAEADEHLAFPLLDPDLQGVHGRPPAAAPGWGMGRGALRAPQRGA